MSDLSSNNPTLPWVSDCDRPCDGMYRGNGKHFRDGSPTAFSESGREASHRKQAWKLEKPKMRKEAERSQAPSRNSVQSEPPQTTSNIHTSFCY